MTANLIRALLCLAIAASPAIASTPTVEVVGYTAQANTSAFAV